MEYQDNTVYVEDDMLAPAGKRFANYLIDFAAQYLVGLLIGLFASLIYLLFGMNGFVTWISEMNPIQELLLSIGIQILYYGIFETTSSRTLGKLITGTKVVCYDGTKPDAGTIGIRTLCRFIPFEVFSFLGTNARGWHDSLSKTYVVDVKKYEAAVELKKSFNEIGNEEVL
ncbi:RDD family protein [Flavobacterium salilacus subsp. salilacus]|uniref:RDD family protein n=1 Tax=Flavobacterium TaxID=237 RepID=UPI001074F614|nr:MULTISPECIES: RDD family protein [Flavobacterium]KAF2515808.1 RDD family protein [Flavobacterium salilacus subsp. salilacus]MBE1615389.1 RDD family protein [Flavobacterium sp. SaA2.13]